MHRKKYRGGRDLSDFKFSAAYDTWRPKKRQKTKIMKIAKIVENVPGRRKLYVPGRGALRSRPSLSFPIEVNLCSGILRKRDPKEIVDFGRPGTFFFFDVPASHPTITQSHGVKILKR